MSRRQGLTERLAEHVATALHREIPAGVVESTKHHVLDTIAAIVAGGRLAAGEAGFDHVQGRDGNGPCTVVARGVATSMENAAFANAMAAHADESDDTHELSKSHPGCSIVPTALAIAETTRPSGVEFLRAVAAGYDVGPRVNMAAWPLFADVRRERRGTPGISGTYGSASAGAALLEFQPSRVQVLFSYVAQQVGGMNTWKRDLEHVEKAFVIAGWPALSAVFALSLVQSGWSGVAEVFEGDPNFIDIVGKEPHPEMLVERLGERFEVERTHMKLHAVGSPAQAPVQALLHVIEQGGLTDERIDSVRVTLPALLAHTVQRGRVMPDINLEYLIATVVADGEFSYEAAHDLERFQRWWADGGDRRIEVVPDEAMEPRRQALVVVTDIDGGELSHRVSVVRGSPENPMTGKEVADKAMGLMTPVVGDERSRAIVAAVDSLDSAGNLDQLINVLAPSAG